MSTPPEQYKNTRKKPRNRLKPKQGSKKYRHLLKFIETRRQKKREKRCTLDRSAQVFLPIENIAADDDDDDAVVEVVVMVLTVDLPLKLLITKHSFCFSRSMFPTSL